MHWLVLNMASSTWYKEVAISSSVIFILKAHSLHIWLPCSAVFNISMQASELNHSGIYIHNSNVLHAGRSGLYIHNSYVLHAGRSGMYPQFHCLACRSIWYISTILMSCMQVVTVSSV